jgi:exopolysaccharide biosynthesis predicted pyruvyltransferase EpsI
MDKLHGYRHNYGVLREGYGLAWMDVIAQSSTVVTDRLHVAVASVLFGERLMYLDPDRLKTSNYFIFTFRDRFNDRVHRCPAAWLIANECGVKRGAV